LGKLLGNELNLFFGGIETRTSRLYYHLFNY
jgi:hypothetical protein